jgi:hypothetical protein
LRNPIANGKGGGVSQYAGGTLTLIMTSPLALLAETRIQEALEAGQDRDLPGNGSPLDLDAYFAAPASRRAGFAVLKSAGIAPPEVEALRQIQELRDHLASLPPGLEREKVRGEIRLREVDLAMGLERMKQTLKGDALF